ncbi:FKBP-type peptidyl-prolyl cis-trans isomerase [Ferruginibacter sp. SUN002]|uniref:FKBP-type peptidyl-prolyl cis-trans isomerase n=1 Tax=Ferruginibacter sp. SUN002 TaxID=2937789 RepID=UPI003D363507
MKRIFYALACATVLISGCKSFKKTKEGLLYKIVSDNKGAKVVNGNFLEIKFETRYKGKNLDTLLSSSETGGHEIIPMDSLQIPPVYYKIFSQTRNGDSVIIKQPTDSILKNNIGNTPPFMKKGAFIISSYKIVNVFTDRGQADSAGKAQFEMVRARDSVKAIAQLVKDDKVIAEYLLKNKIDSAKKAPAGTYVQILTQGTGDLIDTSKVVKVNYTGKVMSSGKTFDSNTDPAFNHQEPLKVIMNPAKAGRNSVIKGWTDGLTLLKKGSKAVFFIPSVLAYGSRGGGDIKPNDNLLFEIEVVDVLTAAQVAAEAEAEKKKFAEMEKKMKEAMSKGGADTVKAK